MELLNEDQLLVQEESRAQPVRVCAKCKKGTLVPRTSKSGRFPGCSTFPLWRHTLKLASAKGGLSSATSV